eukprot:scaffold1912_cov89-Skeletonema_marinoi.AAC.3
MTQAPVKVKILSPWTTNTPMLIINKEESADILHTTVLLIYCYSIVEKSLSRSSSTRPTQRGTPAYQTTRRSLAINIPSIGRSDKQYTP